ncbi:MAG: DUF6160 family protein [Alcanivorax sediminis]|uniref:DUF6160 family protein n=1 Tax=Alcanivorax sediminis TaxID=2663008 RepID=UPI003C631CB3
MGFKKLALAAAVAAAPMSALALEPMQDEALSAVTGQDGISIGITTPAAGISMDVLVHDMDGLGTPTTPVAGLSGDSGAIYVDNMSVNTNGGEITVDIDADGNGGTAVLNVAVGIPTNTLIKTGDISVVDTDGIGGTAEVAGTALLNSMDITLGATTLNIQLGNDPQGSMIAMNTTIGGGITIGAIGDTIGDFSLNDTTGSATATTAAAGSITADQVVISGADGGAATNADVGVNMGIDVDGGDGLVIDITSLGSATGLDIAMTDLALGTGTPIGDVEILGLSLNGTRITVDGH